MKIRILISSVILFLILIIYPSLLLLLEPFGQGISTIVFLFIMTIIAFFVFSGLQKLIVYMIYISLTLFCLFIFPKDYQVIIALTSTFIMIVHPLNGLEQYISKRISVHFSNPIQIHFSGSYWPYFEYRKAMKDFYHMPQSKKLHQNKWYLLSRQFTTLLLLFIGIFIFINETSSIINNLDDFNLSRFISLYVVFWFILMSYYSFKKGFTTVIRSLMIGIFPIIIYAIMLVPFEYYVKLPFLAMISIVFILIIIFEYNRYFDRVTFDAFDYIDANSNLHVYANSLFESIIYNDTYILSAHYLIKISLKTFERHLHNILVYLNKKHIIMTAYAYGEEMLHVYADFHYKDRKKVDLLKTYLESLFVLGIPYEIVEDKHKNMYERRFYHQPSYISARARHLAHQLKDMSNENIIILTLLMYFDSKESLKAINNHYQFEYLENMSNEDYHTIKIDLPVINVSRIITETVENALSLMHDQNGQFIRIMVSKIL